MTDKRSTPPQTKPSAAPQQTEQRIANRQVQAGARSTPSGDTRQNSVGDKLSAKDATGSTGPKSPS